MAKPPELCERASLRVDVVFDYLESGPRGTFGEPRKFSKSKRASVRRSRRACPRERPRAGSNWRSRRLSRRNRANAAAPAD